MVFTVSRGQHRSGIEIEGLSVPLNGQFNGLVLDLLQAFDHDLNRADRLAVEGNDSISGFDSNFRSRKAGLDVTHDHRFVRMPTCRAHFRTGDGHWHYRTGNYLIAAPNGKAQRLVRAEQFLDLHLLPCWVMDPVNLDDAVSALRADLGGRRIRFDVADNSLLIHVGRVFVMDHVDAS